jgi:hypothetical protein
MAFRPQDIKSALEFGGARPSHFQVSLQLPSNLEIPNKDVFQRKISFLASAASLPASTITPIEVSYFARKIKVAGSRTFEDWTITVLNDEDFALRGAFEAWSNAINGRTSNLRQNGATSSPESYKTDALVKQFAKDSETTPIRKYRFQGLFPTAVSTIELNWNTDSEIETFTVNFAYDLWELDTSAE